MFTNRSISRIFSVLFNILLVLTLLIGTAAFPNSASAAGTITVTTSADNTTSDSQCSLREAIINANADNQSGSLDCAAGSGPDTIIFDAAYTITLGSQLPDITSTLIITGNGAASTIVEASISPNTVFYRVFHVDGTGNMTLNSLTIRNGSQQNSTVFGGAIFNSGALTIHGSIISGNSSDGGGGIYNGGTLTVDYSTISGNISGNNVAGRGGGIYNQGTLTLTNSTVSGNLAGAYGGGIYNTGTLTLNNSTVSNNTSDSDDDNVGDGGGIFRAGGTVNIKGSIVAGNKKGTSGTAVATADCSNTMTSQSYNLTGSGTGCNLSGTGDVTVTPADVFTTVLGSLASNGGPTQTHALLTGSPALDQIPSGTNSCGIAPLDLDQRGVTRPQGTHCDIGSFESLPPDTTAPTVSSSLRANNNPTNLASVDFTVTFSESVTGVNTGDFVLTTTGVSGTSITSMSGLDATYTVSVATGTGDGTIRLYVVDDDSILDAASNPLNGGFTAGETYDIDKTAPAVTSFVATSPSSSLSIPIAAFMADDIASMVTGYKVTESSTAPSASDLGWAGTAPTTYTVAADGNYTLYAWAKDAAGNVSSVFGSPASVTVDTTPPTVSSIVLANANPTNLASVGFTVTFSESVTGVDASDFALTTTGALGASVTGVSGSDATYTVSVSTGSGDGTIRLDVLDDDSIIDAASNPLNGGFTGGETYNVDKNAAPTSISLDISSVAGNMPVGTLVGTFSSTDVDSGDTFTYSLVSGAGDADNASFSIVGDQLQTAAVFDSNVKTSYAIFVRTTDDGVGNLFFEQAFTITVTANNITPGLLTPINLELLTINRPTFDWTDVLGSISYRIQIYKTAAFAKSGRVVDTTTTSSTFTPVSDLTAGITLYWRVSRNTAAGAGPWSEIRSFTIALPPDVPGPLSPKSNSKNISLTPSLDWSDSTPFAGTTLLKYELEIATDSAFTSPTSIDTVNSNYTLSTSLNPNTKYYWHVRACNNLGQCSAWSTVRNFTTVP